MAPWRGAGGVAPLHDTFVLFALTRDEALLNTLLAEPTIAHVCLGGRPPHWKSPGVPHDGYLSDFLMLSKSAIGAA
ncbi:hypothetical protein B9W62_04230 [Streptomyces sp. CS113]|uniref:hypothetical protein n=1 Tax=Streptomyces sp. CS113 TaxID=1982761 RepID=UPI000B417241|nr:hypothetical protein [Streptomyces sp. CS113]OWA13903.1 hypothetical protein B9W62_04230 [Streptomyces sp. CS113]